MNSRIFAGAIIGAQLVSASWSYAAAQTATQTTPAPISSVIATHDTASSYDTQALRLESHWGEYRVVRGAKGSVVGTVGPVRSFDVEDLVKRSPVAAAEARVYKANHLPASIVGVAGALSFVTGVIVASNSSNNASTPVMIIAGAGAMFWSAQHMNRAYAALSRSIWWYNRDLKR
jgi:hypothetical protein